ncbi:MAG: DUF4145 domain-containing protein [Pseudomonadota bacterium]
MICPNCNLGIRFEIKISSPVYSEEHPQIAQYGFDIAHGFCPECHQFIVLLRHGRYWSHDLNDEESRELTEILSEQVIFPRASFKRIDPEVPDSLRREFQEACSVLQVSPRASAAMSRRLLQTILREKFGINKRSLADEIDEFLSSPAIPSYLSQEIDAIRNVGNFASHPIKNTQTGEIVDVEPGEAEWLIDVLEALFDFAFIQPARMEKRKNQLNAKLATAGKPPMK